MEEENVEFFCYGPGADLDVVTAEIGHPPMSGRPAVLHGFKLGIQGVENIPDKKVPVPGHPEKMLPVTARSIIEESWGKDFEMYVVREGEGEVRGMMWTVKKSDLLPIEDWELTDFGWYSMVRGGVTLENGEKRDVWTIAVKDQSIRREVDGMNYDDWLGKGKEFKEEFLKHVRENYRRFVERQEAGKGLETVVPITFKKEDAEPGSTEATKSKSTVP